MTNGTDADACPFCDLAPDRVTRSSTHARALADAYPVTDGHTLVVPIRHVASLFDLPADELADVWALRQTGRVLRAQPAYGWNVPLLE